MRYILIIIVLIIAVIAIVNVFQQMKGVVKFEDLSSFLKISYKGPSVATTSPGSISVGVEKGTAATSGSNTAPQAQNPTKPAVTPPPGFTVEELSPYYQKVTIGNVFIAYGNYGMSQISLNASYSLNSPVDITGWSLSSNKGSMVVPQAIGDFSAYGFGNNADIVFATSSRLDIYDTYSPINKNLRMNQCSGYLNDIYSFKPALQCGYTSLYDRSGISAFPGDCQSFILSLNSCEIPTQVELNSFANEPDCRSFLNRFSYAGCYNLKRASSDFFLNQWVVWTPGAWPFDQNHDRVLLLDKNGLLVDEYIY